MNVSSRATVSLTEAAARTIMMPSSATIRGRAQNSGRKVARNTPTNATRTASTPINPHSGRSLRVGVDVASIAAIINWVIGSPCVTISSSCLKSTFTSGTASAASVRNSAQHASD